MRDPARSATIDGKVRESASPCLRGRPSCGRSMEVWREPPPLATIAVRRGDWHRPNKLLAESRDDLVCGPLARLHRAVEVSLEIHRGVFTGEMARAHRFAF